MPPLATGERRPADRLHRPRLGPAAAAAGADRAGRCRRCASGRCETNDIAVRLLSQSVKGGAGSGAPPSRRRRDAGAAATALPVTITLPPRAAMLAAETDVLVVGGGPAGIGAALGAAAAGAEVVLAERYGFLGGNATAALVMPLMSFHTQRAAFEQAGRRQAASRPITGPASRSWPARSPAAASAGRRRRRDRALAGDRLHRAVRSGAVQARRARAAGRGGGAASVPRVRERRDCRRPGARRGVRDQVRTGGASAPGSWSTAPATATSRRARVRPTRSAARRTAWCSR